MITGHYWPGRPKPEQDELLSSWLIRIAAANHARLHTFCHIEWPHKQIWTRDIDKAVDFDFVKKLAAKSGTPLSKAMGTLLWSLSGTVFEDINGNGNAKFIRPIGVRHRKRYKNGLMWCPLCITSDKHPFYRRQWRTILNPTCSRHGVILADSCHECGAPCIPHRGDFIQCHVCETPISEHPTIAAQSRVIQLGHRNKRISITGLSDFGLEKAVHPIVYFDIYRQILKIIVMGARSDDLRHVLNRLYGTDPTPFAIGNRINLEELSASELHRAMNMAWYVLEGWPFMFIGVCAEARIWFSWATKDMTILRYEYYKVTRRFLSG